MSTASIKFQLGTAALALAAAASLAPMVAQADSLAPLRPTLTSFAQSLGDTAGQPVGVVCESPDGTSACSVISVAPANALAGNAANATGPTIFQNQLWWIGQPNPNPPPQSIIYTFQPVNLPIIGGIFGWFPDTSFQTCVLGWTTTIGPYGSVTGSVSRGCA
jgi:hypothetical protein